MLPRSRRRQTAGKRCEQKQTTTPKTTTQRHQSISSTVERTLATGFCTCCEKRRKRMFPAGSSSRSSCRERLRISSNNCRAEFPTARLPTAAVGARTPHLFAQWLSFSSFYLSFEARSSVTSPLSLLFFSSAAVRTQFPRFSETFAEHSCVATRCEADDAAPGKCRRRLSYIGGEQCPKFTRPQVVRGELRRPLSSACGGAPATAISSSKFEVPREVSSKMRSICRFYFRRRVRKNTY